MSNACVIYINWYVVVFCVICSDILFEVKYKPEKGDYEEKKANEQLLLLLGPSIYRPKRDEIMIVLILTTS